MKKRKNILALLDLTLTIAFMLVSPVAAVDQMASGILNLSADVIDAVVTILTGLITLMTAVGFVKSAARAQLLQTLGMRMHLAQEWMTLLELILIFVIFMGVRPVVKATVVYFVNGGGGCTYGDCLFNRTY